MDDKGFNISIIGLGLMGGSLAKALKGFKNAKITGCDLDEKVLEMAKKENVIDYGLKDFKEAVKKADLVIFCVYPNTFKKLFINNINAFKQGAVVTDICGVKTKLYKEIAPFMNDTLDFVGIHPMAGKEVDGYINSSEEIFINSGFIITPIETTKNSSIELMKELAKYIKATKITVSDFMKHDDIIAYTSDLMHISAAGLCVTYNEDMTLAYAAGAFRDSTRVANINAELWSELLIENDDYCIKHLEIYIDTLNQINQLIKDKDRQGLFEILDKACINKKEMLNR